LLVGSVRIDLAEKENYNENSTEIDAGIGLLSVNPVLQAQGVGRFLLTSAEEYAKISLKATRAVLHVIHTRSELIAWYLRRGYKKTEFRVPFTPSDTKFGVHLVPAKELELQIVLKPLTITHP
jgi:GNAT superfamily N-acetyltransferase